MLLLLLIPFLAVIEGVAEPPFQAPDGQVGIAYKFQIPVSNPDNIKLSFKKVAGEIAPGITVDETGVVQGVPTGPAASTCTIVVEWNNVELSRHDYTFKISPSRVQLLDPKVARVKLLPIPAAAPRTPPAPAAASPPQAPDPDPPPPAQLRLEPLTTASDTIEGMSSATDDVVIKRNGIPLTKKATNTANHFTYAVASDAPLIPGEIIQACQSDGHDPCVTTTVHQIKRLGEDTRVVLGFQQVGAAGTDSDQKFFFDFYINRPLPFRDQENPDSPLSWWGNVRVASAPQQINSPVSIQAVTASGKNLKVNELAQSAEFLTGLDYRLGRFLCPLWSQSSNTKLRASLFLTIAGGATGSLKADTTANSAVYTVDHMAADYPRLIQKYPQAANFVNVSFIPPARNQYDTEYFGGIKLVTHYADKYGTQGLGPPALVSFTVGQNELVSGGELRGAVGRVEAFFPLSTGQSSLFSSVYLFGNAQIRLHGPQNLQPYNLALATTTSTPSNTLFVATPSNRDVYSIGLGVDLVKILGALNVSAKSGK
jgi:hypothetical protein